MVATVSPSPQKLSLHHQSVLRSATKVAQNQVKLTRDLPLTETNSGKLIRNFLDAAIGSLAFLRGFFPDETFSDETIELPATSPGKKPKKVNIKRIKSGSCESADLLSAWLVSI